MNLTSIDNAAAADVLVEKHMTILQTFKVQRICSHSEYTYNVSKEIFIPLWFSEFFSNRV